MVHQHSSIRWLFVASCALIFSACEAASTEDLDATSAQDSGHQANDVTDATDAAVEETSEVDAEKAEPDATREADVTHQADAESRDFWQPAPNTTWHWQLQGEVDTTLDVAVYDIDLFDTPAATVAALQARGVRVICYFSAGSYEDWREDAERFEASDYGDPMGNWPGEWWVDIRSDNLREIMQARLDLAASKGCDAVEPDNVDAYQNATGLDLSQADQLDYNRFLARQAHQRGLSIGLKNALDLVATLEPDFDWALNESCLSYDECAMLRPFIDAGKAVFHAEYIDAVSEASAKQAEVCGDASIGGFSTLIFTWELDGWAVGCP
ncbi:endo alpha-1,4 polygalactosaminidase [Bradymonas sediminis]|uniref:Endo alpha-1,4 polygalactosaminidase n=1 Tax=Bradymonas sediminis TaxID=1548548 RepID=A0A2Z4FN32_9DELT|nr:endo alpha-1,4 polygalactosaminidase [Bradymonas sediminis]AWV90078.1 endo alpha-1,4 polygalactosaminidase [Bradymonas sediminis]TDP75955.1 glycosyl hydrolase family 114 [Bradymonas sediminis]